LSEFVGRDFITLMDYTKREITHILDVAADLKEKWKRREPHEYLKNRTVAMIFEKPSTRTRASFQAGIAHLGAQSFYMRPDEMQLARGEPISDTARVIDRYCEALVIRTFGQEKVEEYARYMKHPVINALSDLTHPCQALADLMTIREKKGRLDRLKLAYVGDIWNVCNSLMIASSIFGLTLYVARPVGYDPHPRIAAFVNDTCTKTGAKVCVTSDLNQAMQDADVVYANTFHSMGGPERTKEQRIKDFAPYQINSTTTAGAKSDFIFMHCLPGYRGEEMTTEIVEGPHSVVWDQAENRMHSEKAVLSLVVE
jgi:ornithine carbamoyltransferase